jgi:hypothetical protein
MGLTAPVTVGLTIDEASVVLGILDAGGSPTDALPMVDLRRRTATWLASRIRAAVRSGAEPVEDVRVRIAALAAEHEALQRRHDELRAEHAIVVRSSIDLRRDAHDLITLARATRRLVAGDGPLVALAADDPELVAVRQALSHLAA